MITSFGEKIEDYEVYEILGKGGFASVYRGKCLRTGVFVAIKMINKQAMHSSGMANRVRQEVTIHSKLKHPSILELYTFFEDLNYVYLVLELSENGELQEYLRKRQTPFDEYEAALVLRQVVDGLLYLHSHHILHRDMSLSNLLLTKDMNIKIADFGLATELSKPDEKHLTLCGTPNYISPEVASRASHGLPADVWGLGCMLYTLLVGKPPFDTNGVKSTLTKVVMSSYSMPAHISSNARDLIDRLLQKNPNARIKLEDVLSHPFLCRYDLGLKTSTSGIYRHAPVHGADSGVDTLSSGGRSDLFYSRTRGTIDRSNSDSGINHVNTHGVNDHQNHYQNQHHLQKSMEVKDSIVLGLQRHPAASHISLLQKFNSLELMEKYNIDKAELTGFGSSILQQQQPSNSTSALNAMRKTESATNSGCIPSHRLGENLSHDPVHLQPKQNKIPVQYEAAARKELQMPSQLNTSRLMPTRHRTKHVILTILADSGEVVLEFVKPKGRLREDRVVDVCRISSDGLRFVLYHPGGSRGVPIKNEPPDLPLAGVDSIYSYENIPERHWKKYVYAARFVNMVKAKTPKITLYSEMAKCQLMETLLDYEVVFYDGSKIVLNSNDQELKMFDKTGKVHRGSGAIQSEAFIKYEHFQQTLEHCRTIERTLSCLSLGGKTFPIIIGRRPATAGTGTITGSNAKHSFAFSSSPATPRTPHQNLVLGSFANSYNSETPTNNYSTSRMRHSNLSANTKSCTIAGIGTAMLHAQGIVEVNFFDGSRLTLVPKNMTGAGITYTAPPGSGNGVGLNTKQYHFSTLQLDNDDITQQRLPADLREKIKQMPKIIQELNVAAEVRIPYSTGSLSSTPVSRFH
ncbi:serine/threonine-protein kinase PLK4 [Anopheles ziemanni]|uniref:serine/threonine-protein kinase PLK4 n=1 Tax=Anopheles ziemanni TaxID=345580 RepID=UPI002660117A|nr:serine/threonine-protein kinase PLK4 [Anopheles ziemanni]